MIKYAKDDNTYYFAAETGTLTEGFIITPLGYFCSVYTTDGQHKETVFVTDSTEGQSYYNNKQCFCLKILNKLFYSGFIIFFNEF